MGMFYALLIFGLFFIVLTVFLIYRVILDNIVKPRRSSTPRKPLSNRDKYLMWPLAILVLGFSGMLGVGMVMHPVRDLPSVITGNQPVVVGEIENMGMQISKKKFGESKTYYMTVNGVRLESYGNLDDYSIGEKVSVKYLKHLGLILSVKTD